jgi:2-polyprenyl-6-methoxyphenol hydroxylase-like FAD-dependent oxidoreductase
VFGTPIVHYKPSRLVVGRVALAGDAAHAASPMVGGGFRQGLYDVRALTQAMTAAGSPPRSRARWLATSKHAWRRRSSTWPAASTQHRPTWRTQPNRRHEMTVDRTQNTSRQTRYALHN